MFDVATCGATSGREVGFQDEEQLRSSFDTFSNEIAVKNGWYENGYRERENSFPSSTLPRRSAGEGVTPPSSQTFFPPQPRPFCLRPPSQDSSATKSTFNDQALYLLLSVLALSLISHGTTR